MSPQFAFSETVARNFAAQNAGDGRGEDERLQGVETDQNQGFARSGNLAGQPVLDAVGDPQHPGSKRLIGFKDLGELASALAVP